MQRFNINPDQWDELEPGEKATIRIAAKALGRKANDSADENKAPISLNEINDDYPNLGGKLLKIKGRLEADQSDTMKKFNMDPDEWDNLSAEDKGTIRAMSKAIKNSTDVDGKIDLNKLNEANPDLLKKMSKLQANAKPPKGSAYTEEEGQPGGGNAISELEAKPDGADEALGDRGMAQVDDMAEDADIPTQNMFSKVGSFFSRLFTTAADGE
jgi:hypothetical protein